MSPPSLVEHCAALTNVSYTNFALSLYVHHLLTLWFTSNKTAASSS